MRRWIGSLAAAAMVMAWTPLALADAEDDDGDRKTARVSAVEGHLYARGPFDEEASELAINAVLRAGDEVFTDEEGFAEIELAGETYLRIAPGTSVVLEHLDEQAVEAALADGALYLSQGEDSAPVRVGTFAGTVEPGRDAMVRVGNDAEHSHLWISVAHGDAELLHEDVTRVVDAGETLAWTKGGSDRETFDATRGDAFDRWNDERERIVRGYARPSHLPPNVVGAHDLDGNGTWVYIENQWAWRPTVSVGWRPYSNGYWSWCDPYGWNWVSYEPWGYTTCHYGRWSWGVDVGWCWYPDRFWSPAWVVFAVFGGNVGWAPCDFHGRPACASSHYSHYDRHSWSYCESDYFHEGGGHRRCDARPVHRTPPVCSPYRRSRPGRGGGLYEPATGPEDNTRIRQFDGDPTDRFTPVPVHDARHELAPPRRTRPGVDRVATLGGDPGGERTTLLDRSVHDPGSVRPEPWSHGRGTRPVDRSGNDFEPGQGAPDTSVEPARTHDGWTRPETRGEASAPRARLDTEPRVDQPWTQDAPPADSAPPRAGWTRPQTRGAGSAPRAPLDAEPRVIAPEQQQDAAPRGGRTPETRGEASAPRARLDTEPRVDQPWTQDAPPSDSAAQRAGWTRPQTRGAGSAPRAHPDADARVTQPPEQQDAPPRVGWTPDTRGEASAPRARHDADPRMTRPPEQQDAAPPRVGWTQPAPSRTAPRARVEPSPSAAPPNEPPRAMPREPARAPQPAPETRSSSPRWSPPVAQPQPSARPVAPAPMPPARIEPSRRGERREPPARSIDRRDRDRKDRDSKDSGK